MSFYQSDDDDDGSLHVEICATLLTDKPPKLPLREELPSLGFEIIYNGRGVGDRTSRYESKRALENYRRTEQIKELQKRRIFPKSAKKIRDKLVERRRVEMELKMPHAFSYESYEHQLYDDVETTSSSSGASSSGDNPAKARASQRKLVRGRKLFGMFRLSKSADDDVVLPASIMVKKQETLDEILSIAAFDDVLARSQDDIRVFPTAKKASGKDTVTTVFSGGTSAGLLSGTYSNGKRKDGSVTSPSNMEIQFVASPVAEKYLPGLTTVKETAGLDASVTDAFAGIDESAAIPGKPDENSVRDVFGNLSSAVYEGMPDSTHKKANNAETTTDDLRTAFENIPDMYMLPVDARSSDSHQRQASAIAGCGFSSAACVADKPATLVGSTVERKEGWLQSALKGVLAKSSDEKGPSNIVSCTAEKIEPVQATTDSTIVDQTDDIVELAKSFGSDANGKQTKLTTNKLSDLLSSKELSMEEVKETIAASPRLPRLKRDSDGRLPLHVICCRVLPNRTSFDATQLTTALVLDVVNYKELIELVLNPFPDAALQLDKERDLPVHLLARNLMQWEATWYERVYAQASKEGDGSGSTSADISKLYKLMSRTVELVLSPVASNSELCRLTGSVGVILPLHVASIFTSSVHTLRQIVEAFPEAANRKCDLGSLRTFVPDKSIPLQLHEGLSTDFPKWEEEKSHVSNPDVSWSQDAADDPMPQDWIRRSDLLFAFNPDVEPFRFEKERIRRLEDLISFHTKEAIERKIGLSQAIERLWSWMCTFQEEKSHRPTYVKSVQRIVDSLPHRALQALAAVKADGKTAVIGTANPQCAKLIRDALCENAWSENTTDGAWEGFPPSTLSAHWRREAALLCRSLFNIKEEAMPTSFVILPYQLAASPDGKTVVASEHFDAVAHTFSASLLHMTDPRSILYFLDMKSIKHYDQSIYESSGEDETVRLKTYSKIRELEASLLGLYGYDSAYLYLVDEVTGAPIVPGPEDPYPLVLREPASMVRKLLPMMLLGMVLMRGDKSLSVLVNVLLEVCVTKIPSSWIFVARELQSKLETPEAKELESLLNLKKLKADLSDFLSSAGRKRRLVDTPRNGNTEWNVELSILKMLLDMSDKSESYCGLTGRLVPCRGVVWSKENRVKPESSPMFPDLEAWGSKSEVDQAPSEEALREGDESRDASPTSSRDQRPVPTFDEVRRKCEAIRLSGDRGPRVPDVDELSRKHEALTKRFGKMNFRDDGTDDGDSDSERSAEMSVEAVKLPAKRSRSPPPDDSSSAQAVGANYDSSQSTEAVIFPQPHNDSSDEEARRFKTRRPALRIPEDSETSDDELLRRTRLLLQRSQSPDTARPEGRADPASSSSSSSESSASAVDPFAGRERHSPLFQALAFDPPVGKQQPRSRGRDPSPLSSSPVLGGGGGSVHPWERPESPLPRRGSPTPAASAGGGPDVVGHASTVVWQDLMSELDGPKLQQDDREVILLKVRLAQEAKKLEGINRRVASAERQEALLVEREKELRTKLLLASSSSSAALGAAGAPTECDGVDGTLARARSLLVRLCSLEDRVLFNQIELQHIKLEAYSLQVEIDELNMTPDPEPEPAPLPKARSDDGHCYRRPSEKPAQQQQPRHLQQHLQQRQEPRRQQPPRAVRFADPRRSLPAHERSNSGSTARLSEIHLLPDDLSAASSSAVMMTAPPPGSLGRQLHHHQPQQQHRHHRSHQPTAPSFRHGR